jgi:CheY-like chemotaxis protein
MARRLLLVDDDPAVLWAYRSLFERDGYEVFTAATRAEAGLLLSGHGYDVAVVDLSLSGAAGTEGLEIVVLAKKQSPRAGIILVTAYGGPAVKQQVKDLGVDFYLEKPVSPSALREAVRSLERGS